MESIYNYDCLGLFLYENRSSLPKTIEFEVESEGAERLNTLAKKRIASGRRDRYYLEFKGHRFRIIKRYKNYILAHFICNKGLYVPAKLKDTKVAKKEKKEKKLDPLKEIERSLTVDQIQEGRIEDIFISVFPARQSLSTMALATKMVQLGRRKSYSKYINGKHWIVSPRNKPALAIKSSSKEWYLIEDDNTTQVLKKAHQDLSRIEFITYAEACNLVSVT